MWPTILILLWCSPPSTSAFGSKTYGIGRHLVAHAVNGDRTRGIDTAYTKKSRPADYPPYVSEVTKDEEMSKIPIFVRQKGTGDGARNIYRAEVNPCVPTKDPWWFGFVDGFTLELGSIKLILESARETRLRRERSYARKEPFSNEGAKGPPTLCDLSTPQVSPEESFWISLPARLISGAAAYLSFPYITRYVDLFVTMPADQLDDIASKFGPGISILYGTFISLTLSILYNRQTAIQEAVSVESAQLSIMAKSLISLFRNNGDRASKAAQCVADQIRILVGSSRGEELLIIVYSDPYARMLELIDDHEFDESTSNSAPSLLGFCRDTGKDLCRSRATRLSDESLALPPTHFFILNFLTLFMLLGYTVNIVSTVDSNGVPSNESSFLFAALSTIYLLFYNFASDLNAPFQGVYQIRRSTASAHLLQLKWFLVNHPMLRGKVDFDSPVVEDEADSVRIESPGLGEFWFWKT